MDRINKLEAFLIKQPNDPFLLHALALEYVKLDDDAMARTHFETLLLNNPGYVGSYYHLAKLLERAGEMDAAINIYERGLEAARAAGDKHAASELQMALDDITD